MANRTIRTPKKEAAFLEALTKGLSITAAAKDADIGRRTAYEWRDDDDLFRQAWDDAVEAGTDLLEDEAKRRAANGIDEPVFYKGDVCGHVRKYSDTLMIFMLKARRPLKYRENLNVSGDEGQMDQLIDAINRSGANAGTILS